MKPIRWTILPLLLIALFIINVARGSITIPVGDIFLILTGGEGFDPIYKDILLNFRLTKAFTCILAGAGLAVAGLQMQTLFRNALAGPDVLGLTSGASLAVALIFMGQTAGIVFLANSGWTTALAASLGCLGIFAIMTLVSRALTDNVSLLLVGLMIGAGTSSIVSVLQYLSRAEELQGFLIWTFGSLGNLGWKEIQILSVLLIIGITTAFLLSKSLNAWMLGDNYARSLGIHIKRSRIWIILSASLLTGGITAFCGPLAFVGLAVPHLVKLLLPVSNHRILIPAVAVGGACLLLFCDIVSHVPGYAQILPINAITALIGAPVVIWVILKHKRIYQ